LYRCSLLWLDNLTLAIGWGDKLKICKIKTKNSTISNQSSSNSIAAIAVSGAGLAAALVGNEKKDASTYVEISKLTLFLISSKAFD
jgi:hypothetical protein